MKPWMSKPVPWVKSHSLAFAFPHSQNLIGNFLIFYKLYFRVSLASAGESERKLRTGEIAQNRRTLQLLFEAGKLMLVLEWSWVDTQISGITSLLLLVKELISNEVLYFLVLDKHGEG